MLDRSRCLGSIESLGYTSPTVAVTEAFNRLIDESRKDPPQIPDESPCIPELRATIEGLQLLLQEKDERISDLKRETGNLSIFAHERNYQIRPLSI